MRISKSFSARLSATILLVTSILFITAIMVVSYLFSQTDCGGSHQECFQRIVHHHNRHQQDFGQS